jgi:hypothetical protein
VCEWVIERERETLDAVGAYIPGLDAVCVFVSDGCVPHGLRCLAALVSLSLSLSLPSTPSLGPTGSAAPVRPGAAHVGQGRSATSLLYGGSEPQQSRCPARLGQPP